MTQAELPHRGDVAPLIRVQATSGPPLARDDWQQAEAAARAFCDAQGNRFQLRPASRNLTQIVFEDGVFDFVADCLPPATGDA